ncbi:MAG: hypothetical protein JF616_01185 [Fibrobacteres bacterium]|nr:hypothetical protein [Fibrobacterota bacterium]
MANKTKLIRPLLFASLLLSREVLAGETIEAPFPSTRESADEHPMQYVSLTFSPLSLLIPEGEIGIEMRKYEKLGLGVVAGAGRITQVSPGVKLHLSIYDLGIQANYYAVGSFRHGMQLGFRGVYEHFANPFVHQLPISGSNFKLGSWVGYKYVMKVGLTFQTQIGCQYIWNHESDGIEGGTNSKSESLAPLLELDLGWSF